MPTVRIDFGQAMGSVKSAVVTQIRSLSLNGHEDGLGLTRTRI